MVGRSVGRPNSKRTGHLNGTRYSGRHNATPHLGMTGLNSTEAAQVILSLPDLLHELDAGDHDACIVEGLEPEHRIHPPLHASVILLDDVVQVSAGTDAHLLIEDLPAML